MNHLAAFALCLAGFTALAFASRRQQRDIVGKVLRSTTTYALRLAGASALLLALGILVSVTTDLPLAPEAGLVLGALIGWLSSRVGT